MKPLKDLLDERRTVWEQNKALLDRVEKETRELNTEERAEYDKRDAEIDALSTQIENREADDRRKAKVRIVRDKRRMKVRARESVADESDGERPIHWQVSSAERLAPSADRP